MTASPRSRVETATDESRGGLRAVPPLPRQLREPQRHPVELLVEGDEALGVFLLHVEVVRGLVVPALDEHEAVGVVGAGEEVVGDAAGLGPRGSLRFGRPFENPVASAGLQVDVDDESVHGRPSENASRRVPR